MPSETCSPAVAAAVQSITFSECKKLLPPYPKFEWPRCQQKINELLNIIREYCIELPNADNAQCTRAFARLMKQCSATHFPKNDECATASELNRIAKQVQAS